LTLCSLACHDKLTVHIMFVCILSHAIHPSIWSSVQSIHGKAWQTEVFTYTQYMHNFTYISKTFNFYESIF